MTDPETEDERPALADLPEFFEVSVGGFMGDSYSVRLDADELVYEHLAGGYELQRTERVCPDALAWESFDRWLQVVDPWSWNGEYQLPPEMTVMDGSHWRLRLSWLSGRVDASGDNAYPPYGEGPDVSPQ